MHHLKIEIARMLGLIRLLVVPFLLWATGPAYAQKTTVPQPLAAPGESTEPPRPRGAPVPMVQAQELPRGGGVLIFGSGTTARDLAKHLVAVSTTKVTLVQPAADAELKALGITVVATEVRDAENLKALFTSAPFRAVVSIQEGGDYLRNNRAIADAMKQAGVPRLLMMSSVGVGDSAGALPWYVRLMASFGYMDLDQKAQAEAYVSNADLAYTIVRVGGVSQNPAANTAALTGELMRYSQVARGDLTALIAASIDDGSAAGKILTVFDPTRTGILAFLGN